VVLKGFGKNRRFFDPQKGVGMKLSRGDWGGGNEKKKRKRPSGNRQREVIQAQGTAGINFQTKIQKQKRERSVSS